MLVDQLNRPLRDLRISVTDRCNFRCGYCMPKDVFGKNYRFLPSTALLGYDQIARLVTMFVTLGVRKIRLTGGEPLLRPNLEALIAHLARIPELTDLALTTNASLLSRARAESLKNAGLQRLNISLDAMTPAIYQQINQIAYPLDKILAGVDNALVANFDRIKINMVVQKDINEQDIVPMARYFRGTTAVVRFIEFMDVGNHNQWQRDRVVPAAEIVARIARVYPLEAAAATAPGEVAQRWRYRDGKGEIGVIASITQPFCNDCVRARLSARGELFTCLFATTGTDLTPLLNHPDPSLKNHLRTLWQARQDQYSNHRATTAVPVSMTVLPPTHKVEMSYIGG